MRPRRYLPRRLQESLQRQPLQGKESNVSQVNGQLPLYRENDDMSWSVKADPAINECKANKKMTESPTNDGNMIVRQVEISNKMGLHARPAMQFVDLANKFTSQISVCKNTQCVNAKSIMELLLLAAGAGTVLSIKAEGSDADEAVEALIKLVDGKFGEE